MCVHLDKLNHYTQAMPAGIFRLDKDFREEFQKNGSVLLVAVVIMMLAFAAPAFSTPFLIKAVIQEFGWTREQAVLVVSFKYLTGAVFSILVGYFIDAIGMRRMLLILTSLGGVALITFLFANTLPIYYMGGILLGIATPGTMVAAKVLVSRAYTNGQGTAMGFVLLGISLGGSIVSAIIPFIFGELGWQMGMATLSLGIWFVAIPMILMVPKRIFTDVDKDNLQSKDTSEAGSELQGGIRVLLADYRFWAIGFIVFTAGLVDQAFVQHQVVYLEVDMNMGPEKVGFAVAVYLLVGTWCRPFVGNIYDAMSTRGVSLMYVVLAVSCISAFFVLNPVMFLVFIVLRALAHAAVLMDTIILAKHILGTRNLGLLLGIFTGFVNAGFAAGPWIMARMYDSMGSYTAAFYLFAVFALIAALLLLTLKPVYWLEARQRICQPL